MFGDACKNDGERVLKFVEGQLVEGQLK
jgi:hypothetical protein